jgi:hypothetical protein
LGIGEASSFQASKVLPAGSADWRRRIRIVAWSRPAASSASSTLRTSAGSQRCVVAVAITSGRGLADIGHPQPAQQRVELVRQRRRRGGF